MKNIPQNGVAESMPSGCPVLCGARLIKTLKSCPPKKYPRAKN